MNEIIDKITHSKIYIILKRIFTLDGDKRFIVSSMTYYLTISLVPLSTIIYFFLKSFEIDPGIIFSDLFKNFPEYEEMILNNLNFFFRNTLIAIFTSGLSIYIASKGVLNYYYYLQDKHGIKRLKFAFITDRIYVAFLTLLFCFIFSLSQAIKLTFSPDIFIEYILYYFINFGISFFLLISFNYLLLRGKVRIKKLLLGGFLSTFLLSLSNIAYDYYMNYSTKEIYFGILTQVIAILLYLYFVVYSILIGNNITVLHNNKKSAEALSH